jgi:hypothetical protein
MTALVALHTESALDPTETDLVHSMARISISQTMLLLNQAKDIPVLKRALPILEETLAKHELYTNPASPSARAHVQLPVHQIHSGVAEPQMPPAAETELIVPYSWDSEQLFDMDFLGFDFLDGWQTEAQESTG